MNVAIIPARGGSRRIPRKNIKDFHGKPIIAYSIEVARESGLFQHVYVSTEDDEIAEVSARYGASILPRPMNLAMDNVGTQEVTARGLEYLRGLALHHEFACCIYATAPLMTADDLRAGLYALGNRDAGFPYVFARGWFYWGRAQQFIDNPTDFQGALEMLVGDPRCIDINTPEDWARAEAMYAALNDKTARAGQVATGIPMTAAATEGEQSR